MGRLPPEADQAWLMHELARLVAAGGDRQLVRAPIRRPRVEDFPDPRTGDLASVDRLCRRILRYAGIGRLEVRIERCSGQRSFDGVEIDGRIRWRPCVSAERSAAAWFVGIEDGAALFCCAERELTDGGDGLIGAVAHEVAHAWRAVHGLVERDRAREELLTDLTTVYLGFGLFTVRAHQQGRGGRRPGDAPALPPEHVAFALAAQIMARRTSCLDTWRLLRLLGPTERSDARAALRRLRPAEDVRRQLGLALLDDPPAIDLLRADDRPPVD